MGDKLLFTPGPLTTSLGVKQAMLRDLGSRDLEFIEMVRSIRNKLLDVSGVTGRGYEAIPVQGCGTMGIEAVVSSTVARDGKLLVVINGAYGRRIAKMASMLGIETVSLELPENRPTDLERIKDALDHHAGVTHVAVVHCETSTGILNPVEEIGERVGGRGRFYIVDAMSSFGAVPLNMEEAGIDYLISSANKCLQGAPGFSFVIARRSALIETEGLARSLSFDLFAQWKGLEANEQFRFTPPTHALLAFHQALQEFEQEGGVNARAARYRRNHEALVEGMRRMGFEEYLRPEDQSYIITSFRYPDHPNFNFQDFYNNLNARGFVIYPGKVSDADCFRIGTIGDLFERDIHRLLSAIRQTLAEMNLALKPIAIHGQ